MSRDLGHPYLDPLDAIWLRTAARLGIVVARSDEVFASWDGAGTLTISTPAGFDPDDCLAQMILHELCHALVQGSAGRKQRDWGMENIDDRDLVCEHARHRLQAALTDSWGLRAMLAPTTDHRPYYDALPANPLGPSADPALALARAAWPAATSGPWSGPIQDALRATADLADTLRPFQPDSLWASALPRHPTGLPPATRPERCGGCAWLAEQHCTRADTRVADDQMACRYWQAPLSADDCAGCGACCRRGFDVVDLPKDSPIIARHPEWVEDHGWGPQLPRPDGACIALAQPTAPFRCQVYGDRPPGCRDLVIGGEACLLARRRVGLSP